MKAQPPKGLEKMFPYPKIHGNICLWCAEKDVDFPCWKYHSVCPVQVGDIFYVRETWTPGYMDGCWGTIFAADNSFIQGARRHVKGPYFHAKEIGPHIKWRPSIHMPRWASRTRKLVTGIRVEHGPEISEEDAIAEGMHSFLQSKGDFDAIEIYESSYLQNQSATAAEAFQKLWHSLYGDDKSWRWVYDLDNVSK